MKSYGMAALSDVMDDRVVYRNLQPYQAGLPGLEDLRTQVGIPEGVTPRKNEYDYARVVVKILTRARQMEDPHRPIEKLVYIGDTRLLDSTAFVNLSQAGGWPGVGFICAEDKQENLTQLERPSPSTRMWLTNRWANLDEQFDSFCAEYAHLPVDGNTVVVIDLDKTFLGARGRNGQVIDGARVTAVKETLAGLLGQSGQAFDDARFRAIYDPLNQPEFHPFTADNQDYLAYVCLIISSGLITFDEVVEQVRSGALASIIALMHQVEQHKAALPPALKAIHDEIYALTQQGDPTPFKAFRRNEYRITAGRFGCLPDDAPVEQILAQEITITNEVFEMAHMFRRRGALLFGLSDKPDEAAVPTEAQRAQGCLALHRLKTHRVGE